MTNWSLALNYWLKETSINLFDCSALEIGSRNGGLSLWLALHGARVVCTDIKGPNAQAKLLHRKYGVSHLIDYHRVDASKMIFDDKTFDVVLFKSVLGDIGWNGNTRRQLKAVKEILRVLKPGGELFFAENLVASPFHQYMRNHFVEWGKSWKYLSLDELVNYFSVFTEFHYRTTGFLGAFGLTQIQKNLFGWLDRLVFNAVIPQKWQYIMIGICKK